MRFKIEVDRKINAIELQLQDSTPVAKVFENGDLVISKGLWSEDMFIQLAAIVKHRKMLFGVTEKSEA